MTKRKTRAIRRDPLGVDELSKVVTVGEAARMYVQLNSTLIRHIERGNLTGKKSRGTWIITLASLQRYYGEPIFSELDW